MTSISLLSNFLKKPEAIIKQVLSNREYLLEIEYSLWRKSNPHHPLLEYYKDSKFMVFSNAQDELERDSDTDWDDMISSLHMKEFNHVLDFGCGIGSAAHNLKTRVPVKNIHLYDPNLIAQEVLKDRFPPPNAFIYSSPSEIPKLKFDLIIAWGVFEHLDEIQTIEVFENLVSCLSPNGKIFMKNFYEQEDEYLLHFSKTNNITKLYSKHRNIIIFAKNSH